MTQIKRPIKTAGYAHRPFGAERREQRRRAAKFRQVIYDGLTIEEKTSRCVARGGARELRRLRAAINTNPNRKAA